MDNTQNSSRAEHRRAKVDPSLSHAYGLGDALYGARATSQHLSRLEDALAFGELRPDIRIGGSPRASDGPA